MKKKCTANQSGYARQVLNPTFFIQSAQKNKKKGFYNNNLCY